MSQQTELMQDNENLNSYAIAQKQVEHAASYLGLADHVVEVLKKPMRVLSVSFPVKMDDGSVKVFEGFRSQHNDAIGPTKGGIRFHPQVSMWFHTCSSRSVSAYK